MTQWTELVARLPKMTEQELKAAIEAEANGEARASHLARLHARYSKLRAARERRELLRKA
jgi:hypothetical protein